MNPKDGIILWSFGAAGILFLYSAIKNVTPNSLLAHYFTSSPVVNITPTNTPTPDVQPTKATPYIAGTAPGSGYLNMRTPSVAPGTSNYLNGSTRGLTPPTNPAPVDPYAANPSNRIVKGNPYV